jgi:transcriptional regulator with XRE-family HTH domain
MQRRRRRYKGSKTAEELFGLTLREIRKERGSSQEALAFDSGYHPTYIGQLERGAKSPSLRTIVSLAAALGVAPSDFLKRFEERLRK